MPKRICVINAALTHTIPRTKVLQPYCDHIDYIDVTGQVLPEEVETEKITCHRLSPGNLFHQYRTLKKMFSDLKPDYIIHHFISGNLLGPVLQAAPCPVIGIAMGGDVFADLGRLRRWRDRRCWRQMNLISAKSTRLRDRLREESVTAPMIVNYWGCHAPAASGLPERNALRRELGIPTDCRLLLSMRGISERYNIQCVVAAFRLLVERESGNEKPWRLLLSGRTCASYRHYREEIEKQIRELGLSDRVTIRYDLPQPEMLRYLRAADVTVHLADTEGMPNSMFECWAMGVPTVLRDIPELHEELEAGELVRDGENAYFCRFTPEAVAEKLEIAVLPSKRERLRENAFADFNRYANIEKNAARFINAIAALPPEAKPHWSRHFNLLCSIMQKLLPDHSKKTQ